MRTNQNNQIKEKPESVSSFLKDNKEINIRNFITMLLKSEGNQIRNQEMQITKSLYDSGLKLDNDYRSFMNFIDNEKDLYKKNEDVILFNITYE